MVNVLLNSGAKLDKIYRSLLQKESICSDRPRIVEYESPRDYLSSSTQEIQNIINRFENQNKKETAQIQIML
jgi:hypothetical protein